MLCRSALCRGAFCRIFRSSCLSGSFCTLSGPGRVGRRLGCQAQAQDLVVPGDQPLRQSALEALWLMPLRVSPALPGSL